MAPLMTEVTSLRHAIFMNTELVNDYENLTLNGEAKSIAISTEQLPVCGEVILHDID